MRDRNAQLDCKYLGRDVRNLSSSAPYFLLLRDVWGSGTAGDSLIDGTVLLIKRKSKKGSRALGNVWGGATAGDTLINGTVLLKKRKRKNGSQALS